MGLRNFKLDPFVVGTFCGQCKPDYSTFLNDFVEEVNEVISDGIRYNEKLILIKIGYLVCDTPAISYIRGSKGHSGKYSCIKCTQKGMKLHNRLVFPQINRKNRRKFS